MHMRFEGAMYLLSTVSEKQGNCYRVLFYDWKFYNRNRKWTSLVKARRLVARLGLGTPPPFLRSSSCTVCEADGSLSICFDSVWADQLSTTGVVVRRFTTSMAGKRKINVAKLDKAAQSHFCFSVCQERYYATSEPAYEGRSHLGSTGPFCVNVMHRQRPLALPAIKLKDS